jgi:outer membrane protein insertion porin family
MIKEKSLFLSKGRVEVAGRRLAVALGRAAASLALMGGTALALPAAAAPPQASKSTAPAPAQPQAKPAQAQQPPSNSPPQKLQLVSPKAAAPAPPQKLQNLKTPSAQAPEKAPAQAKQVLIDKIEFRGNRRIPDSTLRARIFSRPGMTYDVNRLERDFHALWNTGYFDDIRLEAATAKDGNKIVIFWLTEKKLVRSIAYKGMNTITDSDVMQAFEKQKIGLTIDSQYDPTVVKRAEVVIKEMLSAHGRQFATVRARTRDIPPDSVALTFIVNEGPKVKIGKITFVGNTVFPNRVLVQAMKLSRPVGLPPWFYWFHKTYDRDKVLYDLEKVRDLYQNRGYFFATPKEPQVKMKNTERRWPFFFWSWGHGKAVDVTIPIDEGHQYRLGKFTIRGNKLFATARLAPFLGMKQGDVFSVGKMRTAIKNFTRLYGAYGYINFVATPDPEPNRKKRVINLTLDFDEGHQYFVHRIEFSGNTKTRDKVIRRQLLVYEGTVFNSELWKLSILRVNQLGFFNPIKKDDYEIRQNHANHTVDVDLKVHEKGRNSIGFSGGVSGLAGNFIGFNYATNNFLGLGETLSLDMEFGTYQKLYQFGFTEPYLFDRPVASGITIFKSYYNYNELQQTSVATGLNLTSLQNTAYGQLLFQNFAENSSGFTAFASYPLRSSFARVGLTYSYSKSSIQAFSSASQTYFEALNFSGFVGPNSLSGITSSQIMPTYMYNTVDNQFNPHSGKYIYAAVGFSGSVLGGNVNTINPIFEAKYFHPINKNRNVLGFHLYASTISGFAGRVPPPFNRFYMGGEYDIRGFDLRTISPVAWFPTIGSVCNRDNAGNEILSANNTGSTASGTCGSSTSFPYYTPIFPGGDTEVYGNFEYRIPIAGPVTLAYFVDAGEDFIWRPSQLQIAPSSLSQLHTEFPYFPVPSQLQAIVGTNYQPRSSTGLELQVIIPMMNIPFEIYYGYNWMRLNRVLTPPQNLPPRSMFPNDATYEQVMPYFSGLRWQDIRSRFGFTVARTF